jgi:hypothetical protein
MSLHNGAMLQVASDGVRLGDRLFGVVQTQDARQLVAHLPPIFHAGVAIGVVG